MWLPPEVSRGQQLPATTINGLIRFCRYLEEGIKKVEVLALAAFRRPVYPADRHPFEVYQCQPSPTPADSDWRTFRVHAGWVSCIEPVDCDDAEIPLNIVVPASTDNYYVWLEIDCTITGSESEPWCRVDAVTIKHGDDPKGNGWASFPFQARRLFEFGLNFKAFILLARIDTASDSEKSCDYWQNVRSDLTVRLSLASVIIGGDPELPELTASYSIDIFGPDDLWVCGPAESAPSSPASSPASSAESSPASSELPSSGAGTSAPSSGPGTSALSSGAGEMPYRFPFEIYHHPADPAGTYRVHEGLVNCVLPDGCDSLLITPGANIHFVWLDVEITVGWEATVNSAVVMEGTDPAGGSWPTYPEQDYSPLEIGDTMTAHVLIGKIDIGEVMDDQIRRNNVRSDLHLATRVWKVDYDPETEDLEVSQKIVFTGPDNFFDCPPPPSSPPESSLPSSELPSSPLESSGGPSSASSVPSSEPPYSSFVPPFSSWGGESKTAILAVKLPGWPAPKYLALASVEMPDVRFEDILRIPVPCSRRREEAEITRGPIDPIFAAACEPGTIEVVAAVPSRPAVIGARVEADQIIVETIAHPPSPILHPLTVTVRLSGIRRGFAGRRFQEFTAEQAAANARFYARAHIPRGRKKLITRDSPPTDAGSSGP